MVIVADTSLLIAHLRDSKPVTRFLRGQESVIAPAIVSWELWAGAYRPAGQASVRTLLSTCEVEPFSAGHAEAAGALQRDLDSRGRRRPTIDLLIASHAVVRRCPLATLDRDYDGIPGLEVVRVKG